MNLQGCQLSQAPMSCEFWMLYINFTAPCCSMITTWLCGRSPATLRAQWPGLHLGTSWQLCKDSPRILPLSNKYIKVICHIAFKCILPINALKIRELKTFAKKSVYSSLLIDWFFLKVFEELLLDADWSVNAGSWMWLSCSSFFQQFFHCYCPVGFGRRTDPNGDYIRLRLLNTSEIKQCTIKLCYMTGLKFLLLFLF